MKKLIMKSLLLVLFLATNSGALTLSDIRTKIRFHIKDSDSILRRVSDTQLDLLINETQKLVIDSTWVISKSTDITLTAETTFYTLPTNATTILRVTREYKNLPEVSLAQLDFDNQNTNWQQTSGEPKYFFQDKSQTDKIGLQPFPTSGYTGTLRVIYHGLPSDLAVDSDEPFDGEDRFNSYHDLLVNYPVYRILALEGELDKAKLYLRDFTTLLGVMKENVGNKSSIVIGSAGGRK